MKILLKEWEDSTLCQHQLIGFCQSSSQSYSQLQKCRNALNDTADEINNEQQYSPFADQRMKSQEKFCE